MSTSSVLNAPPAVQGVQRPSSMWVPPAASSAGEEAIELARMAGLFLDPWEEFVLDQALGERENGKWAAFEIGLMVSRQNGKGAILEARELAGLFLLGEKLIIHSAHEFPTSLEAFRRLLFLIEDTPDFDRRVMRVSRAHGEEGIEFKNGQRIRFRTRTKGGGRGFTSDCLILDEAMILPHTAHGALLPTLSARPNPQVWYTGSAVDQNVHEHGLVFAKIRERGLAGNDDGLAYFEWAAQASLEDADSVATVHEAWAQANPGLGIRISTDHIGLEQRSLDARTFAVERLGIGDWPNLSAQDEQVIELAAWNDLEDAQSSIVGPVCFAFDVKPDRSAGAICVAGTRSDGLRHVEVVDHRPGTGWLADRVAELVQAHDAAAVICDQRGPGASLLKTLENLGVAVQAIGAKEHTDGCGMIFDAVDQRKLRHLGTSEMRAALRGAARRNLGDAWAWSRKSSTVDISPLVACTLALWGVESGRASVYESRGMLSI